MEYLEANFVIDFKVEKKKKYYSALQAKVHHGDKDKWLKNVLSCLWSSAHINGLLVTHYGKPWSKETPSL